MHRVYNKSISIFNRLYDLFDSVFRMYYNPETNGDLFVWFDHGDGDESLSSLMHILP